MRLVQFIRQSAPLRLVPGAELGEGGGVVDISHIAPTVLAIVQVSLSLIIIVIGIRQC